MTNLEYWNDVLIAIARTRDNFAVRDGRPCYCSNSNCELCDFKQDKPVACRREVLNWLIKEYDETDWEKVPPYARVQVCDEGTDDWKTRYFAFYHPEMERKFWVFGSKGNDYMATGWKKCVLLSEEDWD